MAVKAELQDILKERYGINKNISQPLSPLECQQLITLLSSETGVAKVVESFIDKNKELTTKNQQLGKRVVKAEKGVAVEKGKVEFEQERVEVLKNELKLARMELQNRQGGVNPIQDSSQESSIENGVPMLTERLKMLEREMTVLTSDNKKLVEVNDDLKKDNNEMKNIVDAIRLRFSLEVEQVLKSDNSGIRRAITQMYKSVLG
jgi:regulator of replication initiation timing